MMLVTLSQIHCHPALVASGADERFNDWQFKLLVHIPGLWRSMIRIDAYKVIHSIRSIQVIVATVSL